MEIVLPLLIFISLVVIGVMVWLFFSLSSRGQFDDLEAPGRRILMDDDGPVQPPKQSLPDAKSD